MSKMKTPLLPGESLIDMQRCTRAGKAGIVWGGTIFVTNQRIIFETNEVNSKLKEITDIIDVNDVKEYAHADHFAVGWMVPIPGLTQNKSVSIRTTNGDYRFTPKSVKGLMETLNQVCSNAVLGEKNSYKEAVKETIFGDKNADAREKMEAGVKAGKQIVGNLSGKILGSEGSSSNPQVQPKPSSPSEPVPDAVSEIKKYKELVDMGAITEEEFEEKKKQLLSR